MLRHFVYLSSQLDEELVIARDVERLKIDNKIDLSIEIDLYC